MSLARNATSSQSPNYERHQPEQTLLYQVVQQHYPAFTASLEDQGQSLPLYIQREFDDFLQCGRLEDGFLRVRCEDRHHERLVAFSGKRSGICPSCGARRMAESAALLVDGVFSEVPICQWVLSFPFPLRFLLARYPELMGKVLSIAYRTLSTHLSKKAGFTKTTAQSGSVILIQRFGSALNLNVHFHMLFLDGVYAEDAEHTWLTLEEGEEDTLTQLHGHSVTYRIAAGPHQGRKVFTLQTLPGQEDKTGTNSRVANHAGRRDGRNASAG